MFLGKGPLKRERKKSMVPACLYYASRKTGFLEPCLANNCFARRFHWSTGDSFILDPSPHYFLLFMLSWSYPWTLFHSQAIAIIVNVFGRCCRLCTGSSISTKQRLHGVSCKAIGAGRDIISLFSFVSYEDFVFVFLLTVPIIFCAQHPHSPTPPPC